jgi:hypothetical protein
MKIHRFLLPLKDNNGGDTAHLVQDMRGSALSLFGGYTDNGRVTGAWVDSTGDGRVYNDTLISLDVATADTEALNRFRATYFGLFTDQRALFEIEIGAGKITDRPEVGNI